MKFVKMLGLLAIAAAAVMAFAGSASATTLTGPNTGEVFTGTLTAESEGTTSLDGAFVTVSCAKSHVEGKIEQHGKGVTVKGTIATLSFTECNFPVTVIKGGSLELHATKTEIKTETCLESEGDKCTGTLTSTGAEVKITTSVGECIFTTNATDVGQLTTTHRTAKTATFDIEGKIPRTAGNFLCGSSGTWTGFYEIKTPDTLWLDEN